MTNWLTTHYPHPDPDTLPWHIYLQRHHCDAVTGILPGDRVFFYEFARQKPIKGSPKHPVGAQGVVRVAFVSGPIYPRDTAVEYVDGKTYYWSWGVPTDRNDTEGFVGRTELCAILNYKPAYAFFGFAAGTGVKRLDDDVAAQIYRAFKASPPRRLGARLPDMSGKKRGSTTPRLSDIGYQM